MTAGFRASSAEIAAISSMRLLVVSGLAAHDLLAVVAPDQDGAPAARTRISGAGAIGVDLDRFLLLRSCQTRSSPYSARRRDFLVEP